MTDYLRALAGKTLRQIPVASPRVTALFEDAPTPAVDVAMPDADTTVRPDVVTVARRESPASARDDDAAAERPRPTARPQAAFAAAATIAAPAAASAADRPRAAPAGSPAARAEAPRPPDDEPRADDAPVAPAAVRAAPIVPVARDAAPMPLAVPSIADAGGATSVAAPDPSRAAERPTTATAAAPVVAHREAATLPERTTTRDDVRGDAAVERQPRPIAQADDDATQASPPTAEPPPVAPRDRPVTIAARFAPAAPTWSAPTSRAAPTVQVTIGRIEVAAAPTSARAPAERGAPRRQTLDDYLDARRRPVR